MQSITAPELRDKYETGDEFLIVDVRDALSYSDGHLPRAIDIPLPVLPTEATERLPRKSMEVIVYADTLESTHYAATVLEKLGYAHIIAFTDFLFWLAAGYDFEGYNGAA
jgi:phage shock protein E